VEVRSSVSLNQRRKSLEAIHLADKLSAFSGRIKLGDTSAQVRWRGRHAAVRHQCHGRTHCFL